MKKIFKKHAELFLIILAFVFLGILFLYLSWGIGYVATQVNRSVNAKEIQGTATEFVLQKTQGLDFRGLVKPQQ